MMPPEPVKKSGAASARCVISPAMITHRAGAVAGAAMRHTDD